jgi:hypothetical protein
VLVIGFYEAHETHRLSQPSDPRKVAEVVLSAFDSAHDVVFRWVGPMPDELAWIEELIITCAHVVGRVVRRAIKHSILRSNGASNSFRKPLLSSMFFR